MTTRLFQTGVRFQDNSVQTTAASINNRNLVINGNMRVDQRTNALAVNNTNAATYNTVDRWMTQGTAANIFSVQRYINEDIAIDAGLSTFVMIRTGITTVPVLTGSEAYLFKQRIPYELSKRLKWGVADDSLTGNAGKGITLSFWVKVDTDNIGQHGGSITNDFNGTTVTAMSFPFLYTIDNPGVWEQKKIYIPPPPLTNPLIPDGWSGTLGPNGMNLNFSLGVGVNARSTYANQGTWQTAALYDVTDPSGKLPIVQKIGFLRIGAVQIEEGNWENDLTVGKYELLDLAVELAECERYFRKITAYTRAHCPAATTLTSPINHSTMRSLPTATIVTQGGTNQSTSIVVASESASAHRVGVSSVGTSSSVSTIWFSAEI